MRHPIMYTAVLLAAVLVAPVLAGWTTPVPITELNTAGWENGPWLSDDGLTIYFHRWTDHFRLYQATRSTVGSPFTSIRPISEL